MFHLNLCRTACSPAVCHLARWIVMGSLALGALAAATFDPAPVLKRATELEAAGAYAAAVAEYDKVIRANPGDTATRALRGWAKHLARDDRGALADLEAALAQTPDDMAARQRRAVVQKALQAWEPAAADFAQVVKRAPTNARLHRELAYCLLYAGRPAEALAAIDRAVALDAQNVDFFALRGAIHDKLGDPSAARADVERALQLNQDPKLAATLTSARDRFATKAATIRPKEGRTATAPPAEAIPAEVSRLDVNQLAAGHYNGAVSVALEGMRQVMAPLTLQQATKLEQAWAPLFNFPSAENVAYLNKLNPRLHEFLLVRSQLAEAAAAHDKAVEEMRFAARYENAAGTRTALLEAGRCLELLRAQQVRLADLVAQIQQLGDPPDAAAGHRRRGRAHADAARTVRRVAGLPEEKWYVKFDFHRQPAGWSHSWSRVGVEELTPATEHTLLSPDERYAYLIPNDSPIATMRRIYPDMDPRAYSYRDFYGWVEFRYRGADLIGLGDLTVKVALIHAPLDRVEDLDLSYRLSGPHTFRVTRVAGCPAMVMSVVTRDGASDQPWEPRWAERQVIAVDADRAQEGYWVMIEVKSECRTYATSANLPAEQKLWAERSALLRARLASRVQALLDSFDFAMVPALPATEPRRQAALRAFAQANPMREPRPALLCDWERGQWALRPGADPVPTQPAEIQSGNAAYSIFDGGKTVFRHGWTRPPVTLRPGTSFEVTLVSENTVQDIRRNAQGVDYVVDQFAAAEASWRDLCPRGTISGRFATQPAHANPAAGPRRTETRGTFAVDGVDDRPTRKVRIYFTQGQPVEYIYDWDWQLGGDNPSIPASCLPAGMSGEPPTPPPSAETLARTKVEEKWKQERSAEINENIRFLQQCLAREQTELGREADPSRRASYEFRMLGLRSDIVAEEDMIRSLQTGEVVHTRSPFDEYAAAHFVQQCRIEAREASQMVRAVSAANRLAGQLPPEEADRARAFIARQLTPQVVGTHDMKTARQALHALSQTARGHFERAGAQAEDAAATAQFGLDAAENIKSVADNGMAVCGLFGGQSVNLIYIAGTGYVEGGVVQALKAAGSAWSNKIDYAVTAYDTYQKEGALNAAGAVLLKVAQNYAMDYIAGRFSGPEVADPNLRKPTLQEQFEAAKFQQEREWGEALVKDFQRTQADLMKAGGSGATPDVIMKLQAAARDKAAAVASSLHAKNYLKYKADPAIGKAYDTHMRSIHAEADALTMTGLAERKWNTEDLELIEFRNATSFGKPNMDRDVGLRERPLWQMDENGVPLRGGDGRPVPNPAAWTTGPNGAPVPKPQLIKNGKPMTLDEWRAEAQQVYNSAYRKASGGRSAEVAMEGITTSTHPEAYKDLMWLGQDKSLVSRAWAGQAADVTRYKAQHILGHGDPSSSSFTKLQEVARGSAKDMETKLLPLLASAKPQGASFHSQSVSADALTEARAHWQQVQSVLQAFGRNDLDPITATRRIRELTGGKSIPEVVDGMATLMESLAKGGRGR